MSDRPPINFVPRSLTQWNPEECGYTKIGEQEYEQYTDAGLYVHLKRVDGGWEVTADMLCVMSKADLELLEESNEEK